MYFANILNVTIYGAWRKVGEERDTRVRRRVATQTCPRNYWTCRSALCTVWWPTCRWQRLFSSDLHRRRRSLTSARSVFHAQEHPIDRLRSSAKYWKIARRETIITERYVVTLDHGKNPDIINSLYSPRSVYSWLSNGMAEQKEDAIDWSFEKVYQLRSREMHPSGLDSAENRETPLIAVLSLLRRPFLSVLFYFPGFEMEITFLWYELSCH